MSDQEKSKRNSLAIGLAVILVLGCSFISLVLPRVLKQQIRESFPQISMEQLTVGFFSGIKLTDVSYSDQEERFDFTSDLRLKVNWLKLIIDSKHAITEVFLTDPRLDFHGKSSFNWEQLYDLIWLDQILATIPVTSVTIDNGIITARVNDQYLEIPVEGRVAIDNNTVLELRIGMVETRHLIRLEHGIPQYGSGQLEFHDLTGSFAWQVNQDASFILDYLKLEYQDLYLWVDHKSAILRNGSENIDNLRLSIDNPQSGIGKIYLDYLEIAGNKLSEIEIVTNIDVSRNLLRDPHLDFIATWNQGGNLQEVSGHLNQEGFSADLNFEQVQLNLPQLMIPEHLLDASAVIKGDWYNLVLTGFIDLDVKNYPGFDLSGKVDLRYYNNLISGVFDAHLLEGDIYFDGEYDLGEQRASGKVEVSEIDLALLPSEFDLSGKVSFSGEINRESQHLSGKLSIENPRWNQVSFQHLTGDLVLAPTTLTFNELIFMDNDSVYQGSGKLEFASLNYSLEVDIIDGKINDILRWFSLQSQTSTEARLEGAVKLTNGEDGISGNLDLTILDGANRGDLFAEGEFNNGQLKLKSAARNLPLDLALAYLPHFSLDATGKIDYSVQLFGRLEHLNGQGHIQISEVYADYDYLDLLDLNFVLEVGEMNIQPLRLVRHGSELLINGTISGFLEPILDLQIIVPASYLPELQSGVAGELRVQGTLKEPLINGEIYLSDISYPIPYLESFADAAVTLSFENSIAQVRGSSQLGRQGQLSVRGKLGLRSFANLLPELDLDLNFEGKQLEISAPGLSAVVDGKVKINGTSLDPEIEAEINSERGTLNYLGTDFQIVAASLRFDPWQNPQLLLRGSKTFPDLEVYLSADGDLDALTWSLAAQPALSQHEILSRLNWLRLFDSLSSNQLSSDQIWQLLQEPTKKLILGMEQFIQAELDLDKLEINPDLAGQEISISLGKFILKNVYFGYQRNFFAAEIDERFALEQTLPWGITLKGSIDNRSNQSIAIELQKRF